MNKNPIDNIYPIVKTLSVALRWHLDKRRKHVSHIKTRAEMSYSNRKLYKQKGTGGARHATRAVGLFRGGAKFSAKKKLPQLNVNSKFKLTSLRDALLIKRDLGLLVIMDSLSDKHIITKVELLIHSGEHNSSRLKLNLIDDSHWGNVNALSVSQWKLVAITKVAMVKLSLNLLQSWK
ncbi:MAG: 50S ribosomal protein L4 [Candidatus Hodgkinia cicadicola]